jgi:thymidine phosphorylase
MSQTKPGVFFLVVGPSGVGKDSLIDGAKKLLPPEQFVFAKRTVTRPPGMIGEDYQSCGPTTFAQRKLEGGFLVTWQAHGYEYGLPRELTTEQAHGMHIVANGSRSAVQEISQTIDNLVVIHITAPVGILAKRLALRGRETEAQITARLNRQTSTFPSQIEVHQVHNDASLEEGVKRFVDTIKQVLSQR